MMATKWFFSDDIPEDTWIYILYEICVPSVENHMICNPVVELFKQHKKMFRQRYGTLEPPSGALQSVHESWNIIAWRYYE